VLRHGDPGSRGNKRRGGGNIEGIAAIAPGAAGIDNGIGVDAAIRPFPASPWRRP